MASQSSSTPLTVVAVGVCNKRSSRRAAQWATDNLMSHADRFVLLHVAPPVIAIPTPEGNHIPIEQMHGDVVSLYIQDTKLKTEEMFLPFMRLCRTRQMETVILNDDNPSTALLRYISETGVTSLVLGTSSWDSIARKSKGSAIPSTVMDLAPDTCNIYVVSRQKLITKMSDLSIVDGSSINSNMNHWKQIRRTVTENKLDQERSGCIIYKHIARFYARMKSNRISKVSMQADGSDTNSQECKSLTYSKSIIDASGIIQHTSSREEMHWKWYHHNFNNRSVENPACDEHYEMGVSMDMPLTLQKPTNLSEAQTEVERLRLELRDTLATYDKACEDLVHARNQVQNLLAECSEETRRVKDAQEREKVARKIASEEKAKHLDAIKEVELARQLLAKEAHERKRAEMLAFNESSNRKRILDALFTSDQRYKRYTPEEIEVATDCFSESRKIGEGGYGKVYKCCLDHTPVAVKVLRQGESDKKEEFLREVEVLSQIRHPHMVLLLGACPENGCLVYEYMENGSLEDRLFCREGTLPLPWSIRFRIVFEVACGLAFLHSSKPEPVVHRDLKPGNILLDSNFVSKIGDVGMAQILSNVVPDSVTEYKDTILAGTFYYMDPEYQRTGTVRPKSDLYSFGIIVLQLLTAKHPLGLLKMVENAIDGGSGSFAKILDKSVTDWPLAESEELAQIALKCCSLRCRDRPDLESELIPELRRFVTVAEVRLQHCRVFAPSPYICPILKEVMEDPYVAADGFTYEYRAIKAWLEKHNVSPVTKVRFQHSDIIPNHSLRSAIQEWNSPTVSSL